MQFNHNTIQINVSFIPAGSCSVSISPNATIGDLRTKCWNQRGNTCFEGGRNAGKFRLTGAELYVEDSEPVSRLVKFAIAFDHQDGGTPTVLYVPNKFICDRYARQNSRADPNQPVRMSGILEKNSSGRRGKWQKRYFVYQNCTLFWYSDEGSFRKGDVAKQFIAIGGISPKTEHPDLVKMKKSFCFLLELPEHLQTGKKGDKSQYMFAAKSQVEMEQWINALNRGVFVRRVSVCMMALPALRKKEILSMEGIFRLAGDRSQTEALEKAIDKANFPNFASLLSGEFGGVNGGNVHCVADVMKRSLKFMNEPLIPFTFYQSFIRVEHEKSEDTRVKKLRGLADRLPELSRKLLEELFLFLHFAMQFSNTSKMTSNNLAIVFAPNILRPEEETPMTMMDTDNKNRVVSLMIERASEIFEQEEEVQAAHAPPMHHHYQQPSGHRPPPPSQRQLGTPPRMLSAHNGGIAPPPMLSSGRPGGLPGRLPPKPNQPVEKDLLGRPSVVDQEDDDLVVVSNNPSYPENPSVNVHVPPQGPPARPPGPPPPHHQRPPSPLYLQGSSSLPESYGLQRVHSANTSMHSGLPKFTRPAAKTVDVSTHAPPAFNEQSKQQRGLRKPFSLGHNKQEEEHLPPPSPISHKKPASPRPKRPAGPPPGAGAAAVPAEYRGMKIAELNEKIRELESKRTEQTNENRKIRKRIEQITEHVGIFQSTYEDKFDQYLNETVPAYNDYHQAFVELVSSEQKVPEKDIQTQLEKLHEKVKKSQKDHMASLLALTRFYENCVGNLEKIQIQPVEEISEEIERVQKIIEQKKAQPPTPPKPPPKPVQTANIALAIATYEGGYHPETELTFSIHDQIILTNEQDESQGWFEGKKVNGDGTVGWFPASYVKKL